jgi:three-Cys-motif partner protein
VDDFFIEPQGAALLKHEVLRTYVPVYVQKTGSLAPVVLLDGYAGPGRYNDGSSGSPQLMVETARKLQERNVHCIFVEENSRHYQHLQRLLDELRDDNLQALPGKIENYLSTIVREAEGKSLLVFLDPFGLAIPFRMLTNTILSRPRRSVGGQFQPTEVLMNFSVSGINRAAGRLDTTPDNPTMEKVRDARLQELDNFVGGPWWRDIWRAGREDRVELILEGYLRRLQATQPKLKTLSVPVADRWDGRPAYYLVLLTRNAQGLWFFHNAASHGAAKLHDYTFQMEPKLFPPDLEGDWVGQIQRNIRILLAEHRAVRLVDELESVYGKTLGLAREKHVKEALKRLHAQGETPTNPRGQELHKLVVLPALGR